MIHFPTLLIAAALGADAAFVGLAVAFFGAAIAFAWFCEKVR